MKKSQDIQNEKICRQFGTILYILLALCTIRSLSKKFLLAALSSKPWNTTNTFYPGPMYSTVYSGQRTPSMNPWGLVFGCSKSWLHKLGLGYRPGHCESSISSSQRRIKGLPLLQYVKGQQPLKVYMRGLPTKHDFTFSPLCSPGTL